MARNTQIQLVEALKRLMAKKDLDGITVQELITEAKVNRKTFYYHFHDMPDFLFWIYTSRLSQNVSTESINTQNWTEHLQRLTAEIRIEKDYIRFIYASKYAQDFRQAISRMFDRAIEVYLRSAAKQWETDNNKPLVLSETCKVYLVSYHSTALLGMLEQWFRRGMRETDEELAQLVKMLANDSLVQAFNLMNEV